MRAQEVHDRTPHRLSPPPWNGWLANVVVGLFLLGALAFFYFIAANNLGPSASRRIGVDAHSAPGRRMGYDRAVPCPA